MRYLAAFLLGLVLAAAASPADAQQTSKAIVQMGPAIIPDPIGWIGDHQLKSASKIWTDSKRGLDPAHTFTNGGQGLSCWEDALSSGPYHQFCITHDAAGNAVLKVSTSGGAPAAGLMLDLNGTISPVQPGSGCPGCGTMASQNATAVAITGGAMNGVSVGGTTAMPGSFSSLVSPNVALAGGAINGTSVGGTAPAAGTFSTLASGNATLTGGTVNGTSVGATTPASGRFSSLTSANVALSGGAISGTTIGATAPSSGTFSTLASPSAALTGGTINGTTVGMTTPAQGNFSIVASQGPAYVQTMVLSAGAAPGAVFSVALGGGAPLAHAQADHCLAIGWNALNAFTRGTLAECGNTAIGQSTLQSNVSGEENTAVGQFVLASATGSGNTAVGQGAMQNTVTGQNSVALGWGALYENVSGNYNTAIGYAALFSSTAGTNNVAVGQDALYYTTGNNNVGIGYGAGINITNQTGVVILGNCEGSGLANYTALVCDGVGDPVIRARYDYTWLPSHVILQPQVLVGFVGDMPNTSNYALSGATNYTLLNAPGGGSLNLRLGNADQLVMTTAGITVPVTMTFTNLPTGTAAASVCINAAGTLIKNFGPC